MNLLVTGGAGFIGLHLVRRLLHEGCTVAILDNFSSQVHGANQDLPCDLADHVELYRADVRDRDAVCQAMANRDAVVHLAAETGTGQSMYEISRYQDVNIGGTAAILDAVVNRPRLPLRKIIVASSRAVYGEGKYRCVEHGIVYPSGRFRDDLRCSLYEPLCPVCKAPCSPEPTTEDSPAKPLSFYGLTKYVQEEMTLMFARARGFSAYALRYQNVYGPGQSLRNPYTGILAIFSSLARTNSSIQIFEDGRESRDFVFVEEAVEATWRFISREQSSVDVFNIGSGKPTTVLDIAHAIAQFFGSKGTVEITGAFREGDIRHNFADLSKLHQATGFVPQFHFNKGLEAFLDWVAEQDPIAAQYDASLDELRGRGLLHG